MKLRENYGSDSLLEYKNFIRIYLNNRGFNSEKTRSLALEVLNCYTGKYVLIVSRHLKKGTIVTVCKENRELITFAYFKISGNILKRGQ